MKKQTKNLMILALVLIFLVLANIIIKAVITAEEARKEEEESRLAAESVIHIKSLDNINSIQIKSAESILSFSYDKNLEQWIYSADTGCPVNQTILEDICNSMTDVTAIREFTDPDTLESYGLSNPSASITLTDNDGNSITYQIGDALGSEYYFKQQDEDTVYTVSSTLVSHAFNTLADFVAPQAMPDILNGSLTHFYAATADSAIEMSLKDGTWHYTSGELMNETLNVTAVNDMIYALSDFTQADCADYGPTDTAYEQYGLNNPYLTFILDYTDENKESRTITVKVGNLTDNGSFRYYQTDDSPVISTVQNSLVQEIVNYISYNYIQTAEETGAVVTEITE